MSVALENARLFDETQRLLKETEQRAAELAIINSVQEGLASKLEMQAIYDLVGDKISEVFDSQDIMTNLASMTAKAQSVYSLKMIERAAFSDRRLYPLGSGLSQACHRNRATLIVNENATGSDAVDATHPRRGQDESARTRYLAVPIDDRQSKRQPSSTFKITTMKMLSATPMSAWVQTLASSMSVALENARLFDETQRLFKETEQRAAELPIINSVQEGLASKLEMQAIYDLVGDKIREIFKADTTFIAFHDSERNLITAVYYADREKRYSFRRPYSAGLYEVIIESGKPLLLNTAQEQEAAGAFHIASPDSDQDLNQSFLGVPIFRDGKTIGATSIQSVPGTGLRSERPASAGYLNQQYDGRARKRAPLRRDPALSRLSTARAELAIINSVQQGLPPTRFTGHLRSGRR